MLWKIIISVIIIPGAGLLKQLSNKDVLKASFHSMGYLTSNGRTNKTDSRSIARGWTTLDDKIIVTILSN
jgi:hypothetical protein